MIEFIGGLLILALMLSVIVIMFDETLSAIFIQGYLWTVGTLAVIGLIGLVTA